MTEEITISRDELYKLVWSKPVVKIAIDFGVSDVAVGKICKKLNIPKPGLGYWAKKQHGKRTRQAPLPKQQAGYPVSYTIRKSVEPRFNPESETIQQHRIFEEDPKNKVIVKSSLRSPRPLVQTAKSQLSDPYTDWLFRKVSDHLKLLLLRQGVTYNKRQSA